MSFDLNLKIIISRFLTLSVHHTSLRPNSKPFITFSLKSGCTDLYKNGSLWPIRSMICSQTTS